MEQPTIKVVFDLNRRATKTNLGLVQIYLRFMGERKYVSTDVRVYKDQWNNRQMVVNRHDSLELNKKINEKISSLQDWLISLQKNGETFTFSKLNRFINTPAAVSHSLLEFIERRIEERNDIKAATKKNHRKLVRSLKEFNKIEYLDQLSKPAIMEYDNWLHAQDYVQTTIYSYHKFFKSYINQAVALGLIDKNPYTGLRFSQGKSTRRKYVLKEDLKAIEALSGLEPTLERVRDVFLFQCYTGLAYSDLAKFDFKNCFQENGKWKLRDFRQKTNEEYNIVLLTPALEILRKYSYVLPVITNQQYNLRLKAVAGLAGLKYNLTSHMGRHTFAVVALSLGVRMENVSKMLGHTRIATTEIYAKVLNESLENDFAKLEYVLHNKELM